METRKDYSELLESLNARKSEFRINKLAIGRHKDLADIEALEGSD